MSEYKPRYNRRLSIESMQQLAIARRGKCISTSFTGDKKPSATKLLWECEFGHQWNANPNNIKKGKWCPECKFKKLSKLYAMGLDKLNERLSSKKIICISPNYKNGKTKLQFKCEYNHTWWAQPTHVVNDTGCPICAGSIKHTIEEMQSFAKSKGGKCLSTEYKNWDSLLEWECKSGHTWWASGGNVIKKGNATWCPYCRELISEKLCREHFRELTGKSFLKARPQWLWGKHRRLELDGYNPELNIAFEYQGIQHYNSDTIFSRERYAEILEYDNIKRRECTSRNILLIEIPYTVPRHELKKYIMLELQKVGVII